jgi:hypothetical protein
MTRSQLIIPMLIQMWVRMLVTATLFGIFYGVMLMVIFLLQGITERSLSSGTVIIGLLYILTVAAPVGAAMGAIIGAIIGLVVSPVCAVVTLTRYYPMPHNSDYSATIRAVNTITAMACMMIAVYHIVPLRSNTQLDSFLITLVLQVVLAGVGTWWTSGYFARWYEYMLYLSPKRKNDDKNDNTLNQEVLV